MKIDKIIFSVDDNPRYSGLWKINSEICKKVLGVTPVLFHITDEESDFYEDDFGIVKKVKKLNNYPSSFQAQIYRLYGTKYFKDQVCLVSDIDLLLVNKNYLTNTIKNFNDDDFVVFSDDAYDPNRSECVGIYSYPRIYMCYNASKGRVFNEILNTNRNFDSFADEVFKVCPHHHDCDEIYLGTKINFFENQSRIKRMKRGFTSPFICSNRIERPQDEDGFNQYDNLSRPYSKYKKEIDELKEIILGKDDEVYLIGCHLENDTQEKLLRQLINTLENNNKKFVLTSHTLLPQDIIEKSIGFVYDSINPKYKTWELDGFPYFRFDNEYFTLDSQYISYGASDYYHVGVIRLIINGLKFLSTTNYKVVHWVEYDTIPDFNTNKKSKIELTDFDFVFYGVGCRFSFNLDRVSHNFLKMNNDEILCRLKKNNFLAERMISNELICGEKKVYYLDENETNTWGRYSQNHNSVKINWSLFENNGKVKLFLHNISNENQEIELFVNDIKTNYNLQPYNWFISELSNEVLDYFEIKNGDRLLVSTSLLVKENYNNIIKKVNFTQK